MNLMKIITILYLIYTFLKSFYYSKFELQSNNNKPAAIAIFILAILRISITYFSTSTFLLVFFKYSIITETITTAKPNVIQNIPEVLINCNAP